MDTDAALHIELVGVVAVGAVVVVIAAAVSGACGGDAFAADRRKERARVDDVERALDAMHMTYEQAAAKKKAAASSPAAGAGAEEGEDVCSICLSEYASADEVRMLHCGHFYHPQCIGDWLRNYQQWCPLCRGGLSLPLL